MTPREVAAKLLAIEDEIGSIRRSLSDHATDVDDDVVSADWPVGFAGNIITLLGYVEQDVNRAKAAVAEGKRESLARVRR